jgi:lipopolysaccharide export system protein LptA
MRTLVLVAGGLLVTALVVFLAVGRWKNPFNRHDLPQKLGFDIQSDSGGITYTRARGGHTLFKIHASKVEQLKKGNALLHDVKIELYSKDGSQVDRIEGAEFEYDKSAGTARAAGTVEITLMRPGEAPAIAPKAATGQVVGDKRKGAPVAIAAETAARGEIHVKTSGLTLTESADQKSGVVTTSQRVDFSMVQGAGSSTGASYDSDEGLLVLDHAVELTTQRGTETIVIHAQHGEFERASQICRLRMATANYGVAGDFKASTATAGEAKILFREDGSAARLDATNGFTLATATGSHLSAPTGQMDFNAQNQPSHGHLEGGVTMDSASETAGRRRRLHGTAPTAVLEFTRRGQLQRTHLETGVLMESEEQSSQAGQPLHVSRHWRSSVADVEFRESDHARIEPKSVHGMGGVLMTSESQLGKGTVAPSRLSADELTGEFGADSVLTAMTGVGHASIEETTATGARQTTSGDRLEAKFAELTEVGTKHGQGNEEQLQSAMVQGHVVLTQTPAGKPGGATPSTLRATSGRADYQGQGEWLHLSLNPRVEDGALQLTADKVDVSRASGDAFAHGNVKASWSDLNGGQPGRAAGSVALGGQGPAHVVAAEAQLHQATGEVTFRGQARLWQQANSVAAPVIVLDRTRQTLTAQTANAAEPVKAVLVSAGGTGKGAGQTGEPSVVRVRGGDLRYSDVERKALMRGGVLGTVTAETGTATSTSDMVEVLLLPAGKPGGQATPGQAQVDHLTARGHVVLSSEGRRGTGEQLVYTGATGEYVLTGTASTPPRMTDSARGSVTGEVLIFQSRDRSVTVESGSGRKSMTETMAPR